MRIKNSRTAARAVLNIMAHYGFQPLSYKSATFAEFMLLALRVFTEERSEALRLEERVHDVLQELQARPPVKPVGVMLEQALRKSALTVGGRTWLELTVADLLFLSRGRGYRYTKIVGGQEFKARIDEVLTREMQALSAETGVSPVTLSMMLASMVKLDLYTHFSLNAPSAVAALPALQPFARATLYLALKSFLMARQDVFDPELRGLGVPLQEGEVRALQRFLQIQGIYRFSDWFPQASHFLNRQFDELLQKQPERSAANVPLSDPDDVHACLQAWLRRQQAVNGIRSENPAQPPHSWSRSTS